MSSSTSWGKVAMSCVLRSALADELVQQQARDHVQRLEYTFGPMRRGGEERHLQLPVVEQEFHVIDWGDVGQVALVVLEDVRDLVQVELEGLEVFLEVVKALDVFGHFLVLGIGDEDDAVDATQDE